MRIDILSLFPNMFQPLKESILGKALEKELLEIEITDFRDYTTQKQRHVDDTPYGGGAGMLLQAQPIFDALAATQAKAKSKGRVILLDPAGRKFDQKVAEELAKEDHLTFICGHYEGYDARIYDYCDYRFCIGDYILTGGELGAMVIVDSITRLIPGVINAQSLSNESFSTDTLEYDQFTRPLEFEGKTVPYVLTNGNHGKIQQWKRYNSLVNTKQFRNDMWNMELESELNQLHDNQASFMETKED